MSTHLIAAVDWWLSTLEDAEASANQSQNASHDKTNSSVSSNHEGLYGPTQPLTWAILSDMPFPHKFIPETPTTVPGVRPAKSSPSRPPSSDTFVRAHLYPPSTYSEPPPDTSSLILNSGYRSTWELLKSLPAPTHTMQVLPTLPTHYFTPAELNAQLPDPVCSPLVSS